MLVIEGEDGHVDFRHDRAQESGRFERAQALLAQRFAQRVDFGHDFAQRVVGAGSAAADGIIALAQRCQKVGHGLQRKDDAAADGHRETGPERYDQDGQRPLDFG